MALCLMMAATTAWPGEAPAMARVRVAPDGEGFVLAGSGERFVPWGFNYLGRFGSLAEEDWHTTEGWRQIEEDFREMRELGANVVRWHLQLGTFMRSREDVDPAQISRLKDLLGLARRRGLYLDLTGLNCYRLQRIPAWYDELPEDERWRVQARFWGAVAEACAGDPVVWCYDLMNEPVITEPREGDHPWVGGELGGFHFVQRISNAPAGRDTRKIAEAWVAMQVRAIRDHDREGLITVGVIPWAFVWENAKPLFYAPGPGGHLDFVSIHVYPGSERIEKDLAALGAYEIGKPLVIEEIFPLNCSIPDLNRFIDGAANRVSGWVSHYFGHSVREHREGAMPGGAIVADFLEYWSGKRNDVLKAAGP